VHSRPSGHLVNDLHVHERAVHVKKDQSLVLAVGLHFLDCHVNIELPALEHDSLLETAQSPRSLCVDHHLQRTRSMVGQTGYRLDIDVFFGQDLRELGNCPGAAEMGQHIEVALVYGLHFSL
jgi:hypothetical protein